jgi:beta-glucosidase
VSELVFPDHFLWGTATAAHQVEGNNSNSDWWEWELRPDTPCREPSGTAIDHYNRFARDIGLLAGLRFNTYRFSVEWSRIEPREGEFDEAELEHYRRVAVAAARSGLTPMVTLYHFSLPQWVAKQGGWLSDATPALLARYCRRVVEALGDDVEWYCTINEPGVVAFGGYMGAFPFPPGTHGVANWTKASEMLVEGHRQARAAVKELRPGAMVGQAHSMQEWESNQGGQAAVDYIRHLNEDVYLEASREDDFVGVQTYTRTRVELPRPAGFFARPSLSAETIEKVVIPQIVSHRSGDETSKEIRSLIRRTQMGYEFRPEAVAATVRRVAELLPGKPIVVTEHGVATTEDTERIEFITEGLKALHPLIGEGIPLRGYIHWSAFDNFEWAYGYAMKFGLIAVDRTTQERTVKPSARFLGAIARTNRMTVTAF